jgi:phosphohistidine phosphatase
MKRLYLLRHAKSSWDDPDLDDRDRPLAPRGRRASKAIAGHVRSEGIAPELVLCSSATRARETLERIEDDLGGSQVSIEDSLYGASAATLLGRLRNVQDEIGSVMLIGHQPAIQQLALELAGRGTDLERLRRKFPTAALATLEFAGTWSRLGHGDAALIAYVKPRELARQH